MTLRPLVLDSVAIPVAPEQLSDGRQADIVVDGLEQGGGSFRLRVFLNDPAADADTEMTARAGYAGSIHVYGYGLPSEPGVGPDAPARLPMTRRLAATEAIRAAAEQGPEMTVTLVPLAFQDPDPDVRLGHLRVSVLVHE